MNDSINPSSPTQQSQESDPQLGLTATQVDQANGLLDGVAINLQCAKQGCHFVTNNFEMVTTVS